MRALARFSLAHRALIALITVFCTVFGVIAAGQLKQELVPSLELPVISVTTVYPGAGPEVVDDAVGEPLERALQAVEGLESTRSTSSNGFNAVLLQFEYGTDLNRARGQVDRAVSNLAPQLPDEAETTSFAGSFSDFPVMFLAVSSDSDLNRTRQRVEDVAVPRLQRLEGVRGAEVTGGTQEYVSIVPDQAGLAAAGLSTQDIVTALEENAGLFPIGQVTEGSLTLPVQAGSPVEDIEDLKDIVLVPADGESSSPDRAPPALGDVAEVSMAEAEPTSLSRTNGVDTLSLSITATPDADLVRVSEAVEEILPELEGVVGDNARFTVVFDQAPFIQQSIDTLFLEGVLGLGFAVLVIAVFLLSLRSTLVTAVSIPLSLLATLIGVWLSGYSLNMLTLGALTIAIGRVVDDSIVVVENIRRHLGLGEDRRTAIVRGTGEVGLAITASTLTSVAVFLPVAFVSGLAGELFRPFAVTMSLALLVSLLVALTIVPVLSFWFLGGTASRRAAEQAAAQGLVDDGPSPSARPVAHASWLSRAYRPVLRGTQAHPKTTIAAALAVLVGTGALVPLLPTNLLGDTGQNSFTVTARQTPGSSLEATTAAAEKVDEALRGTAGVQDVQFTVGSAGMMAMFGGGATDEASFTVITDPAVDQPALQDQVRGRLARLQDVGEVEVSPAQGFGGSDIEVTVTAPTPEQLSAAAEQVADRMRGLEGVREVTTPATDTRPTFQVEVDPQAAAAAGLTEEAVSGQVAAALDAVPSGQVRFGFTDYTVRLGDPEPVTSRAELEAVEVMTPTGPVALSELAEVRQEDVPASVTSSDGERTAVVSVTPGSDDLGAAAAAVRAALDGMEFAEGVAAEIGGAASQQEKTFRDLGLALLAAVAAVYVVMVATFRSLLQPFVLLVSIPFAATGAFIALLVTGTSLGLPSLIGMLMLVGVVVTNAIVLIDLINQYRRDVGLGLDKAIELGALNRVRPVVMTALATILALMPMALGVTGHGGFISQPLAVAVVGGLLSSTVLTLVVLPVLYRLAEARGERRRLAEQSRIEQARAEQERQLREAAAAAQAGAGDPAPAPGRRHRGLRERLKTFSLRRRGTA
ncbi:efflux RND transporter permease subunit [Micrococcus lylae]|uniref:efflux RND transporter permease subunit n=1 Tax=Micrococcus lylae TaxID=1273 RepID=UPI0021A54487|nr:efflux RND transporter permease subunit [Micrococcus lylae]MCT2006626.1 efflux RND transporter permease subunit [Micrococcus lylae]MCT2071653.1 efflux RND transporter permease subunit [Micrococcus lylae]